VQTDKYGAQRTCVLEAGASETLRVAPVPKRIRAVAPGKGTWSERWGTAINLHFEGNWMPLLVRRRSFLLNMQNPLVRALGHRHQPPLRGQLDAATGAPP
jgi:hypothetical protein